MTSEKDKAEFIVYDDDPCLGKKAPSLESLKFFNGEKVEYGNGKITVVTFYSKLNKGDFPTLTVLTDIEESEKFKNKVQVLAISRDGDAADVEKFCGKYQDKRMDELKGPKGEAGVTVKFHYPIAYDEASKVNKEFKNIAKKAVIGVGFTFIVDEEGVIRWYEKFVRGANPMGQFEQQLENIVNKTPLISNGKMPEVEDEEEEEGDAIAGDVDVDPFGGAGEGY